jgi:hypothetical protein
MLGTGIKLAAALGFAGAIALSIAPAEAQAARKKTDQSVVTSGPATAPSSMRRSYGLDNRGSNRGITFECDTHGGPA